MFSPNPFYEGTFNEGSRGPRTPFDRQKGPHIRSVDGLSIYNILLESILNPIL
jgi:hypothetical protein